MREDSPEHTPQPGPGVGTCWWDAERRQWVLEDADTLVLERFDSLSELVRRLEELARQRGSGASIRPGLQ